MSSFKDISVSGTITGLNDGIEVFETLQRTPIILTNKWSDYRIIKYGRLAILNCINTSASTVVKTLPEAYRPCIDRLCLTGWGRNIGGSNYYPAIASIGGDGVWDYLSVINTDNSLYYVYNSSEGVNRLSTFNLWLTGT